MAQNPMNSQEQQLEACAQLQHRLSQIESERNLLWSAQTDVCALLVLDAGLGVAEVARVAGMHRHTVTKAVNFERTLRGMKTPEEIATRRAQIQRHVSFVTDMTRRYD